MTILEYNGVFSDSSFLIINLINLQIYLAHSITINSSLFGQLLIRIEINEYLIPLGLIE